MKNKRGMRDSLAEQRTHLANERTLLAYWRTAFSFFVVAVVISKFVESKFSVQFSILLLVFSVLIFIYGLFRFRKYRQEILETR